MKRVKNISFKQCRFGLVIIFLCLGALAVALFLLIFQRRPASQSQPIASPTVTPIPNPAQAILSFSPKTATLQEGEIFTVEVLVDADKNKLSGAELYISYDFTVLEALEVLPGNFFGPPEETNILLKEIDNKNGKISYALGTFSPRQGKESLALIKFKAKAVNQKTSTTLSFAQETKLADINEKGSVIKSMGTAKYTIVSKNE